MAKRIITTTIALDGEKEFKQQLSAVNGELRNLKSDMRLATEEFRGQANSLSALTAKHNILQQEVDQQQEKVRALSQALQDATDAYGENDARTDRWRQSLSSARTELIRLQRELDDTTQYMEEAENSADGMAESLDGMGRSTGGGGGITDMLKDLKASGNFDELIGNLGKLKGSLVGLGVGVGVTAVATALKELGEAAMEVEESTREYRTTMANLESSSEAAGYSAEETAQAYDYLYGVLGESEVTATTVANLQALHLPQEKLKDLIDGCIGAWAKYGDSIPIDSLAEAINETIQVGKVTGTFADVLNWAGVNEDEFNELLAMQPDLMSRASQVMGVMSAQGLPDMAAAWRETNPEIIEANDSVNRWEASLGHLGKAVAPIASGLRDFGAFLVDGFAGAIETVIDGVRRLKQAFSETWNSQGMVPGATNMFEDEIAANKRRANGSHRSGLSSVPYDGYMAELHANEAVLTAGEAETWRDLQRGARAPSAGLSAGDVQQIMSSVVSSMGQSKSKAVPTVNIRFTGNLAQLARVLKPEIDFEGQRAGNALIGGVR